MAVSSIEATTAARRVLWCVAVSVLGTHRSVLADPGTGSMVAANGRLEGGEPTSELHFAESGRIAAVLVAEGQVVKKGDRLALLDCAALSAELQEARGATSQ